MSNYLIFLILGVVDGRVRTWLRNSNVLNEMNWEEATGCRGLILPDYPSYLAAMGSAEISRIVLPIEGGILLNNGDKIVFNPDDKKCIKVKEVEYEYWLDPRNWSPLPNKAIPDVDRVPCRFDDVVFPENSTFNINFQDVFPVKSIKVEGHTFTKTEDLELYIESTELTMLYTPYQIPIETNFCNDPETCSCHESLEYDSISGSQVDLVYESSLACYYIKETRPDETECETPIQPRGHCTKICGALIDLDYTISGVSRLNNYMKRFKDIDYFIHDLDNDEGELQLVLVDKESYSGISTKVAEELQQLLQSDHSLQVTLHHIQTSGAPRRDSAGVIFATLFGTFILTLTFLGIVYVYYMGLGESYSLSSLNRVWKSEGFRPFVFARFENKEDGGLSFERTFQEEEPQRSFDNPMYGLPSTSQESADGGQAADEADEADTTVKSEGGFQETQFEFETVQ